MKNTLLAVTFFAITAFAVDCKPAAEDPQETTSPEQFDQVKE
jgi:hypothetical protein